MAVKTQEELLEEWESTYPSKIWDRYNRQKDLTENMIDTMFSIPAGIPSVVLVDSPDDLSGALDSTSLYVVTGVVDMGAQTITVPNDGLTIYGSSFNTSGLFSSENNYKMFDGGGTLVIFDLSFGILGTGSQLFDLGASTGQEAVNMERINFNGCTSLGEINGYRQYFEAGTGRFGGTPSLTFSGTWLGGATITQTIVRGVDNAMTAPIFAAGTGLLFNSRFISDANIDLGTTAPLTDFAPANFNDASLLQFNGAIIARNGARDPNDSTLTPNITASDLQSNWKSNIGLNNTYEGGRLDVTTETATVNPGAGVFTGIAGTWTPSNLVHFSEPVNGRLQHDGDSPREYTLFASLTVDAGINNELTVRVVKFNGVSDEVIITQTAQVTFTVFSQDVARFVINTPIDLDEGQTVRLQIANESNGVANMTALSDSYFFIRER